MQIRPALSNADDMLYQRIPQSHHIDPRSMISAGVVWPFAWPLPWRLISRIRPFRDLKELLAE